MKKQTIKEYYVIVNLENLAYQNESGDCTLDEANTFSSFEIANEVLENIPRKIFTGAVYKVTENVELKLVTARKEVR